MANTFAIGQLVIAENGRGIEQIIYLAIWSHCTCVDREDEPKRDLHLVVRVDDDRKSVEAISNGAAILDNLFKVLSQQLFSYRCFNSVFIKSKINMFILFSKNKY